jgi:hypothetical protein
MTITNLDKFKCAERELALRKASYPKAVGSGKLSHDKATREIDVMAAIVEDYRKLVWDPL